MKTNTDRIAKLEDRVAKMSAALRIFQRQVILLTRLELQRMDAAGREDEISERICAEAAPCMAKHPYFGDD